MLPAVEHAVSSVEPLLRQVSGYPGAYLAPVESALNYSHQLAASLPGPVTISRESYARDPLVHALFPSLDSVTEAICSSRSLQDHLQHAPDSRDLYALMGMRRREKNVVGMQLSGQLVQHDVMQNMIYFISHTIENPATSETEARERVAMKFFDSLVDKVAQRITQRKQERLGVMQEKDLLTARLHNADARSRPELEARLSHTMDSLQASVSTLELERYPEDFKAVLLNPALHLRLDQTAIKLDGMGVRRNDDTQQGKVLVFDDLIGYDRRNWTVTMVRFTDMPHEAYASRLERAYRTLTI